MDETALELAHSLVNPAYIDAGVESIHHNSSIIRSIFAQRRLPMHGLSDVAIEQLLYQLSNMDSNNFAQHIGAGEREGRVLSALVQRRHYYFTHGIGRSGDVTSDQPKAAGSSLMASLTNHLVKDALVESGATNVQGSVVIPMATGMTLSLVLRTVAKLRAIEDDKIAKEEEEHGKERKTELCTSIKTQPVPNESEECEEEELSTSSFSSSSSDVIKSTVRNAQGSTKVITTTTTITTKKKEKTKCTPQYVIWPRVDQKTALKCIDAAGFTPLPIEPRPAPLQTQRIVHKSLVQGVTNLSSVKNLKSKITHCLKEYEEEKKMQQEEEENQNEELGDKKEKEKEEEEEQEKGHPYYVQVHVKDIVNAIHELGGREHVLCVLSTTSCFAPRLPDDVIAIAKMCKEYNIAHVINNAYGMQSVRIMRTINTAMSCGRVDFFVQSGDKNFLVPVGGAVIASCDKQKIQSAAAMYAGRASGTPSLDIFITLLHLGKIGLRQLWKDRYERLYELIHLLDEFAHARHEMLVREDMTESVVASFFPDKWKEEQNRTKRNEPSVMQKKGAQYLNNDNTYINDTTEVQHQENKKHHTKHKATPLSQLPRNDISLAITMWHYCECIRYHSCKKRKEHTSTLTNHNSRAANTESKENKEMQECVSESNADIIIRTTTDNNDDCNDMSKSENIKLARSLGAKLFRCGVTGPKVVTPNVSVYTTIAGCEFASYGMHSSHSPCAMLIVACGIGMKGEEVHGLLRRLNEL